MHLMFGIDGSEQAIAVLERGLDVLAAAADRITLAYVVDYDGSLDDVSAAERTNAESALAAAAKAASARFGGDVETAILVGRPAQSLVRGAKERSCDLLVVGPRGKGASRVLFGSVASHLARGATVPVVIMPPVETS